MRDRYSKHHGLGNDFLVTLTDSLPLDAVEQAVALCNRHTGIGADGLIFGIPQLDGSMGMRLLNSDGSPAALSGNGLRCLRRRWPSPVGCPTSNSTCPPLPESATARSWPPTIRRP